MRLASCLSQNQPTISSDESEIQGQPVPFGDGSPSLTNREARCPVRQAREPRSTERAGQAAACTFPTFHPQCVATFLWACRNTTPRRFHRGHSDRSIHSRRGPPCLAEELLPPILCATQSRAPLAWDKRLPCDTARSFLPEEANLPDSPTCSARCDDGSRPPKGRQLLLHIAALFPAQARRNKKPAPAANPQPSNGRAQCVHPDRRCTAHSSLRYWLMYS
jgi:hypothetical protein